MAGRIFLYVSVEAACRWSKWKLLLRWKLSGNCNCASGRPTYSSGENWSNLRVIYETETKKEGALFGYYWHDIHTLDKWCRKRWNQFAPIITNLDNWRLAGLSSVISFASHQFSTRKSQSLHSKSLPWKREEERQSGTSTTFRYINTFSHSTTQCIREAEILKKKKIIF